MRKNNGSYVISFKLLPSEIYLWKNYSINIGMNPSRFLISKVNRFLSLNPLKGMDDSEKSINVVKKSPKFKQLIEIEKNKGKNGNGSDSSLLKNVSLRLNEINLKKWEEYRKERYFSRTTLIRQTLNRFFSNKPDRLSLIIGSLICEVGSIDFQRLKAIFDKKVDISTLIQVLNKLEEEGTITRKRQWDNYVPTNPPEYRSGSLMLGELLSRFI